MTKGLPTDFFGQVFFLEDSQRYGIMSVPIMLDGMVFYQAYPISLAVYMASDFDLILTNEATFGVNPVMLEYWNPLLFQNPLTENIKILGKLEKDSFDILKEYLAKKLLSMTSKHKFFTGPPISSNQDIRLLFRKTELEAFFEYKREFLDKVQVLPIINKKPIKNAET